ncbi:ubiquitin-like protein-NEDD8-like protein RUB3 [Jatropha curcas]|uniref:ubiquitin-like protein-NEDD8-like protein RUB3 n=1 Tax=Jatropha curcas TaxID=180498 RepID=UPI0005FC099D|nr:ubiquitin-like protein-NEDD8-like protein RUB3 [Jatropha curcas]
MDVFFETQRGRPFSIEVGFFDTVLEIKEKIQKYQGIPVNKQTLIFNGQVLQDDRDVEHCEILQNSHIQLLIAPDNDKPQIKVEESSPSKKIQLSIKIPSSKLHVPLEMDLNDTVLRLKEKIQEMESVPIHRLILQSNGGELQDNRSLHECELMENSEINVNIRPSPTCSGTGSTGAAATTTGTKNKLKLMVLTKCGTKKIPVEMNASDNVGELRKELQKLHQKLQFHLPQEGYFFIYKQNVMDEDQSFRWHHVCQGDTIEIFNGSVTGGS